MSKNNQIKCCDKSLEFRAQEGWQGWEAYQPEEATCVDCNTYFARKLESNIAYKMNRDETYNCTKCGSSIRSVTVTHPIWDGGRAPGSGSGRCDSETVPYCPKCETKPTTHGLPIKI